MLVTTHITKRNIFFCKKLINNREYVHSFFHANITEGIEKDLNKSIVYIDTCIIIQRTLYDFHLDNIIKEVEVIYT